MRALLKATDEIDAMAVNTAMHLKALTDRSDGSKQLPESVMEPGSMPLKQIDFATSPSGDRAAEIP